MIAGLIPSAREPIMKRRAFIFSAGLGLLAGRAALGDPAAPKAGPAAETPLTFKAKGAGVLVYVESDRQRVTGLDADGKVLWHKDVTAAVTLKTRGDRPARVIWLGAAQDWMVKVM